MVLSRCYPKVPEILLPHLNHFSKFLFASIPFEVVPFFIDSDPSRISVIASTICRRREMHTGYWQRNVKEMGHLHELTVGLDRIITLRRILQRWGGRVWTVFI
jgi:hypothetical protein